MTEKEAMEMLAEDISSLRLPPISEKVFLAMREKRQESLEMNKTLVPTKKPHKRVPKKIVFAAMVAALVTAVPIIVILADHSRSSDVKNRAVIPESGQADVNSRIRITSTLENKSDLERIKLEQVNGAVALSGKSEEELENILEIYSGADKVYEDDIYLYNFDSNGKLCEVHNNNFDDESSGSALREEIDAISDELFYVFFPDRSLHEYKKEIIENVDARPAWEVNYSSESETVFFKFENSGQFIMALVDEKGTDIGNITISEAVDIVLKELRSGKYDVSEFDDEDVIVNVKNRYIDDRTYYMINADVIPISSGNEEWFYQSYCFLVDVETGECSLSQ